MPEDIKNQVSSFMQEQMAHNIAKNQAKAQAAKAASSSAKLRGMIIAVVSLILIGGAIYWTIDQTRPPGFVLVTDVTEKADGTTMTVSGKVKNSTRKNINERTYIVTYIDPAASDKKKPFVEVPVVIKDLKAGESKDWSVQVPNWKPGLKLGPVKKKEDQG